MPFSDAFNEFSFIVSKHDGFTFRIKRTFNSKFEDVYSLIDHEKADIIRIRYDSLGWYGMGACIGIEYLTTETTSSGRKSIIRKYVTAESVHNIPVMSFIHDMYVHERFLKYFKVCLKYNEPEIEVT